MIQITSNNYLLHVIVVCRKFHRYWCISLWVILPPARYTDRP